tara:strand:- start:663 stop:947 length:285 start_codon:yes stop_codon:yes gene_type:complete
MTKTNTQFNQKTTQMTDTKIVTYLLENDWDGTLQTFNNLSDAFTALGDYDLKLWYDNRDDIPAKSNFIIQRVINGVPTIVITRVKASILFNLKK